MLRVETKAYQPKGGMCWGCVHLSVDCSHLPFHTMPVIEEWQGIKIVRCTRHQRREVK